MNEATAAGKGGSRPASRPSDGQDWPDRVCCVLKRHGVGLMAYVPDAGHARTIELLSSDPDVFCNVLTTEEEGVAIAAGAWLGGLRGVLLMQSSGVGNCINMLSLPVIARLPLLMLVTMRGEWEEFNPWQVPMGLAVEASLKSVGVHVMRADTAEDLIDTVASACTMAYEADQQIAVLISQRILGKKTW
jgi:sulfopyruvate decarboxylase alpha subunit